VVVVKRGFVFRDTFGKNRETVSVFQRALKNTVPTYLGTSRCVVGRARVGTAFPHLFRVLL